MTVYRFSRCEISVGIRSLTVAGIALAIEPKVFDLIIYLIEHRDRVVSKDELLESVWPGRIVSDSAVSVAVNAARKAVGDSGKTQHTIKTLHKQGFRFVAEVTSALLNSASVTLIPSKSSDGASDAASTSVRNSRPTLAIVPRHLDTTDSVALLYAFMDDVATELSRFHLLSVLAPHTSFSDTFQSL